MDKNFDSQRIARGIKAFRHKMALTQQEMAWKVGYSERQMRRLETEGTLNLGVLNTLAEKFNVSAMDILMMGMS